MQPKQENRKYFFLCKQLGEGKHGNDFDSQIQRKGKRLPYVDVIKQLDPENFESPSNKQESNTLVKPWSSSSCLDGCHFLLLKKITLYDYVFSFFIGSW